MILAIQRLSPTTAACALVVSVLLGGCAPARLTGWPERIANRDASSLPKLSTIWDEGEPRVFTIFCLPTGGHRHGRDGEIVTEFAADYWGRGDETETNAFYRERYQRTFLILDGVGTSTAPIREGSSEPIGLATSTFPEHPMPGDFWPDTLHKPLRPERYRVSNMVLKKTALVSHRGDLHGDGWDDNVAHALFVLEHLRQNGQFPEVINMIGWSRGAVTAVKLANAIDDHFVDGLPYKVQVDYEWGYPIDNLITLYPPPSERISADRVETNLFLIDPVPGRFGGNGEAFGADRTVERFSVLEQDYQRLPPTTRRCITVLANDEQREGFAPTDANDLLIENSEKTRAVWLSMPGNHRTPARLTPLDPIDDYNDPPIREHLTAVPLLTWNLAFRFLTLAGTQFERHPLRNTPTGRPLTDLEIVELYSDVWLRKEQYHQARNRGVVNRVLGGLMPRIYTGYPFAGREFSSFNPIQVDRERADLFTAELGVYVKSPGFFVNEHHRAAFAAVHPSLYAFLTTDDPNRSVSPAVEDELHAIHKSSRLWSMLRKCGIRQAGGRYLVSEEARLGSKLGEPLRLDGEPHPARFTGMLSSAPMKLVGSEHEPQP